MYDARVLAHSVSPSGYELISILATFPRFILAEANTHRMLSRNSASSRAIPVEKRIEQVLSSPFVPESIGRNQKGMQAHEELDAAAAASARDVWIAASQLASFKARELARLEVHKQLANRVIEPFVWHTVIFTATEWSNWDALRISRHAQPEMYKIAGMMREVRLASVPVHIDYGSWHLPLVRRLFGEQDLFAEERELRVRGIDPVRVCVGRCAAVSYERHLVTGAEEKDAARYDTLLSNGHMSPFEHACRPMDPTELDLFAQPECVWDGSRFLRTGKVRHFLGNVEGWVQQRKMIPGEDVYTGE